MSRNIALDLLKLLLSFMVVGLHAGFLGDLTHLGQYLTVNGLFRTAVPVFLIINGFYFYPALSNNKQKNWLKRVSLLYAIWMVFYSFLWLSPTILSFAEAVRIVHTAIFGYHHLWYISGMIGAAVLLLITYKLPSVVLFILSITTFLIGVLIQYIGYYHILNWPFFDKFFNFYWLHRNAILFSYPFFCVGYLINKHSIQNLVSVKLAFSLSAIGLLALLGESYVNFTKAPRFEGESSGFDNFFFLILGCPFLFILFTKIKIRGESKAISFYSAAVYFIHPLFLITLLKFTNLGPTLLTLVTILFSLIISPLIIKINNKLGYIL